ncbi:hypothetical protein CUN59_18375 [Cuspidothrix issatschenkoi CHARLIE-1]|uniref:Uncharacterized protein n=1 Tax=Cuspidothrix issatschenkoi CHARLIE-1 TaxID=2052836 RepID=A0A2S6CQM4_9CYAN|nr:hypothetical protein CUN59_18375 [Cuspidothrix issatschenkoi CHARLIE-1]
MNGFFGTNLPEHGGLRGRKKEVCIHVSVFSQPVKRAYLPFGDVPDTHWTITAIKKIYETGFYLFPVPCSLLL